MGFIVETLEPDEGIWLVPTGPLTNIAMALRRAPDLADRLAGISLMGGSATFGNRTPVAEFNIWADPEAAAVVFDYGGPLIRPGSTSPTSSRRRRSASSAASLPDRLGPLLGQLLEFFATTYVARHDGFVGAPVHDPSRGAGADPSRTVPAAPAHVAVETSGAHTRGMTVIDLRTLKDRPAPNVRRADDRRRRRRLRSHPRGHRLVP